MKSAISTAAGSLALLESLIAADGSDIIFRRALGSEHFRQRRYSEAKTAFDLATRVAMQNTNGSQSGEIDAIDGGVYCSVIDASAVSEATITNVCKECYWNYDLCQNCLNTKGHKHSLQDMIRIPSESLVI